MHRRIGLFSVLLAVTAILLLRSGARPHRHRSRSFEQSASSLLDARSLVGLSS
jgi:hypothetical protein